MMHGHEKSDHAIVAGKPTNKAEGSAAELVERRAWIALRPSRSAMSELGVRREKAALSSGCEPHPATAPAGSNRSSYGGDEIAEAFGMRVTNW